MSSTMMIPIIMVGVIALVVGLLVFVNHRDRKIRQLAFTFTE